MQRAVDQMFAFLNRDLFQNWDGKIRRLLLSISFFDRFTIGLAQALTGDSQVERTLHRLLQISSFIDRQDGVFVIRYEAYRIYLQREAEAGGLEPSGGGRPVRHVLPASR